MSKRTLLTCLALFCASEALFLARIAQPPGYSFDEVFYVPAARALLAGTSNLNPQHPPLAKYLIAAGIALFGDRPVGWRIISALFGGLTVVGMYAWGRALFRRHSTAVWVGIVALLSQILYIHARTAMLEVFLVCFLVWAIAAFCAAWTPEVSSRRVRALLTVAGIMLGLATACKWMGIVAWGTAIALIVLLRVGQLLAVNKRHEESSRGPGEHWLAAGTLRDIGIGTLLLALVVVPAVVYFATFLPLLRLPGADASWHALWHMQVRIWQEHGFLGPPVQMSRWYSWAFNTHPMGYWYERDGLTHARTVLLIGNPVILWTGVVAALFCAWEWLRRGSREAFLITAWYGALYLSWAVLPRRTTFFYYYFPAALALIPALAYCFERLEGARLLGRYWRWLFVAAAALMFAIEYPISSAIRVPIDWLPW